MSQTRVYLLTSICPSCSPCRPVSQCSICNSIFMADLLHKITDNEADSAVTSALALSLHQPVQTCRYTHCRTFPIVIQMLGWWLKCLSLLIGACKGITAEGERVAPRQLWYGKSHLWAHKQHYLQRTEYQVKPSLQPLHLLSWISSMFIAFFPLRCSKADGAGRVQGRLEIKSQTHVLLKVRFVSLLFLLSWSLL